ncbi:MAG: dipicolinate synthase subunit DpsA [Huintestinicola sp.]|uniref:dipicolinate synthase subunit DpsA n=1 Tax=Huintestinicola sp. TaxID=2981661 RepID=UPI003F0F8939
MSERYIIAGGDMRFSALAEQLSEKARVCTVGFDKNIFGSERIIAAESVMSVPYRADCLVLPLPVSSDGITLNAPFYSGTVSLSELTSCVKKDGIVFGGRISPGVREMFSSKGIEVVDYFEREELAVLNALATAEGALQIALEEQPVIISGSNVLILGMGRIAKSLIRILQGFGAHITVSARKYSDLAWAEVFGCEAAEISELENCEALSKADIIFNTVPHLILNEDLLKCCNKSCLIIDLASKPGGMDMEAAGRLGLRAIWALSLPGKTAPVSSGRMIAQTIENILHEKRR